MSESRAFVLNGRDYIFVVLLALISTVLSYRFGTGNQLEQLPLILRELDTGFLARDFFLSSAGEFGPRVYFVNLMSWVCQWLSLPWAYALFTFLSDLALVLVTHWAARNVIGAGRLGAALACVMVLAVTSFNLGDAAQIRYAVLQPASLAIPGALWAIGLGLRGRAIAAACVAALSSLPHPLYGVEAGAIALGTAFFVLLAPAPTDGLAREGAGPGAGLAWRHALVRTASGAAILGVFIAVFWVLPYQAALRVDHLSSQELFDILVHFRSPHHYLPGVFRPADYVATVFFLLAGGIAFERWSQTVSPRASYLMLLPVLVVLIGCLGGYLFTEIWPLRAVLTLQPFRLLSIIQWLGLMLMGQVLASYWLRPASSAVRPLVALSLLSAGSAHPLVTVGSLGMLRLQPWRWTGIPEYLWLVVATLVAVALWYAVAPLDEAVFLVLGLGLVAALCYRYLLVSGVLCLALVAGLALGHGKQGFLPVPGLVPQFDFSDQRDEMAEAARAAGLHTPADALFITPPKFGLLRLIGQRALVVDFKAIPLQDGAMREWRERIRATYGDVDGGGFTASSNLDQAYRQIDDHKLQELAQRYGASHALLYAETVTDLPVLYTDKNYRIVELSLPGKDL